MRPLKIDRQSQYCSLVNHTAFGEAAETEQRRIDQICLAQKNQIAENLSCCGGMHHAVSAETVREKKPRHARRFPQNGMMVRRHLVEPGPRPLRIHRKISEARNPLSRASENFLYEACVEIGLESRGFFWIVPCQQKTAGLGTKVKSIRHVDDHRRRVRESVKGLRGHQHAPQRLDG